MHKPRTWRELLGASIENTHERERIAQALGVSPVTLVRWAKQESNPRPQNLRHLLNVLPMERETLLELIQKEYHNFSISPPHDARRTAAHEIPSEFYARVFRTYVTVPRVLRFTSLSDLVVQQILEHLDAQRQGLAVMIACCMPPSHGEKVRSLRECLGRGTSPWGQHLEQEAILLGSESLAGYAVTSHRLVMNPDLRDKDSLYPGYKATWEASAVAAPIRRGDKIAGAVLISSAQANYFQADQLTLTQSYADLLGLAFDFNAYYERKSIELWALPPHDIQKPYLTGFRQRILSTMLEATEHRQAMDFAQAEQLVWQQIEQELIQALLSNQ
ncbi:GAF domain-containing protein [Ktedonosporobacter rubrisoli]|uniref:GAF domain-containing protein n=1 Tax=Ktedonosporobacter rubrisoli TaxID=2509675 RepID=A0A4P6JSI0_KTERU|nr:GAF domain-containing protein [Ktedonosporobacter rubrisoli]QBD78487.1 GAF domain-containing protein [Ktedonosporobacter rubrisoli]